MKVIKTNIYFWLHKWFEKSKLRLNTQIEKEFNEEGPLNIGLSDFANKGH